MPPLFFHIVKKEDLIMSIVWRACVLFLIIALGVGVLDLSNTLEMRVTALIMLLLLFGSCLAYHFIEKQQLLVKQFTKDLSEIRAIVAALEQEKAKLKGMMT
jgi:hypothetical protein